MKSFYFFTLIGLLLTAGACKEESNDPNCSLEIPADARFFEFAHQGSDYTFIAWTRDSTVLSHVEAQLALPEAERVQHINGQILEQPEGCDLNTGWSWYFNPEDWDLADLSIELCDGNPQYVEDHLEDYLDIDRYCPWSSYVSREISQPQ
ncbi:BP74-related protein [Flavilitoribacter nigricans]|uniref:BP74 N-terminal domain-containing protein n=1 Tax=Flavilitoribacter nigricans (strain ATCC 23147 / DSM 23189 / NBRC 102662 / NCIMB 1420 / SS-2) TaxID=1122177 RepID=A0A2D0N8A8_FLAN2|nr:hypothetical protein [Flavilitoribacter nigricans]PHN04628.1 hypothetical protein CRP01_21745 [Flavilitoribacter nigricans DSM 23189 = NBRC 102662]